MKICILLDNMMQDLVLQEVRLLLSQGKAKWLKYNMIYCIQLSAPVLANPFLVSHQESPLPEATF